MGRKYFRFIIIGLLLFTAMTNRLFGQETYVLDVNQLIEGNWKPKLFFSGVYKTKVQKAPFETILNKTMNGYIYMLNFLSTKDSIPLVKGLNLLIEVDSLIHKNAGSIKKYSYFDDVKTSIEALMIIKYDSLLFFEKRDEKNYYTVNDHYNHSTVNTFLLTSNYGSPLLTLLVVGEIIIFSIEDQILSENKKAQFPKTGYQTTK